jgi:four helix bundle protein
MITKLNSFKELVVWQKSIDLVIDIYKVLEKFPSTEIYGITSQLKRAMVSIPSNIAEGSKRGTRKDYSNFLRIAIGSTAEVETLLELSIRLNYINKEEGDRLYNRVIEIQKMLSTIIFKLKN